MTLSKRLAIGFAGTAAGAIVITVALLVSGMALEIQRQIDHEARHLTRLTSALFQSQCASMQTHMAALAGDQALRLIAEFNQSRALEFLENRKTVAHVDSLHLFHIPPGGTARVIGESLGGDFLPDPLPPLLQRPPRVRPFFTDSGRLAAGYAAEVLPRNPGAGEYWLLGVVELEDKVVANIAALLGIQARMVPFYPKELAVYRLPLDLFSAPSHSGLVELRDCGENHLAWLQFEIDLQPYREALWRQAGHSAAVGVFIIVAAGLVGMALARRIAAPLERIQAAAERMEAGDLHARADFSREYDREICHLSKAFNGMAETLAAGITAREQMLILARRQLRNNTEAINALRQSNEPE